MKIPDCDRCKGRGYTKINSDKSRIRCNLCLGEGEDTWARFMYNRHGKEWLVNYLNNK